jgi:FKBP-type peptidyl-prolyl cis-trans isomerase FklB
LKEGFGDIPTEKDRVVVHYTGKLINGNIFDSSINRGEPSKFMVAGVIPGWVEALQIMSVGSKWELVIPSNLAYGDRATGNIPAASTLIFEVELLGIE